MDSLITIGVAVVLIALIVLPYYRKVRRTEIEARKRFEELQVTGLHAASSMHPQIDVLTCIGCGSCVAACPEEDVFAVMEIMTRGGQNRNRKLP